jgi:endo-1,4-beta-D-glucanase Y
MGYGMLITVLMSASDPDSKAIFEGLDRFRRRFPSSINPEFMCWKIPPSEHPKKNDSATDGDLDIAFSLLLADKCWGSSTYPYLEEAKNLIRNIGISLIRPDYSLRLGDWNSENGETRTSDFMPINFRAFHEATGNPLWEKVENRCYEILEELQCGFAPDTGLLPDFSVNKAGTWVPAKAGFLEGPHDGDYYYNACRVPWRLGWALMEGGDARDRRILERIKKWRTSKIFSPEKFAAGYRLDGTRVKNGDFDTACFISPTGVSAMALGDRAWKEAVFDYAIKSREEYYEDTLNLLCLIIMSGEYPMKKTSPQKGK